MMRTVELLREPEMTNEITLQKQLGNKVRTMDTIPGDKQEEHTTIIVKNRNLRSIHLRQLETYGLRTTTIMARARTARGSASRNWTMVTTTNTTLNASILVYFAFNCT